jgi:hypothetical protein
MSDEFDDEDAYWEEVFETQQQLALGRGCEPGSCFTFTCQCRTEAIETVTAARLRNLGLLPPVKGTQ